MDEKDKKRLMKNRVAFVNDVDPNTIMNYLDQEGAISEENRELIGSHPTRRKQCEELLDIILTRGPKAYKQLRESIKKDYEWLVNKLDSTDVSEDEPRSNDQLCSKEMTPRYTDLGHATLKLISDNPNVLKAWKSLARQLGLHEHEIIEIEHANSRSLKEQCYQTMVTWKNKTGRGATLDQLKTHLKDEGHQQLVGMTQRYLQYVAQ